MTLDLTSAQGTPLSQQRFTWRAWLAALVMHEAGVEEARIPPPPAP